MDPQPTALETGKGEERTSPVPATADTMNGTGKQRQQQRRQSAAATQYLGLIRTSSISRPEKHVLQFI
jgi:hypothetical protein